MIFPTPFLARNNLLRSPPKSLFFMLDTVADPELGVIRLLGSTDHKHFLPMPLKGDIAGQPFIVRQRLILGGRLFISGTLSVTRSISRAAVFRSALDDLVEFEEVQTGLDAETRNNEVIGIVANANYLVIADTWGGVAVSTDGGDSFTRYTPLNLAGAQVQSIGAGSGGFVVGVNGGGFRTATDPRVTWTIRTSGFDNAIPGYNTPTHIVGSSSLIVGLARAQIATTPANAPASFTRRTTPPDSVDVSIDALSSDGGSIVIATGFPRTGGDKQHLYIRSVDGGLNWNSPATGDRPYSNGASTRVTQLSYEGGHFFAPMSSGLRLARSPDGLDWEEWATNITGYEGGFRFFVPLAA